MVAPTPQKVEATVMEILKHADVEQMTEFEVRTTVSERLGIDLSDVDNKKFIRSVIESFLLSTTDETSDCKEVDKNVQEANLKREVNDNGDRVICQLSNKRSVMIQEFRGKALVSIREFYQRDGKQLPSSKGISLTSEQWAAFRKTSLQLRKLL